MRNRHSAKQKFEMHVTKINRNISVFKEQHIKETENPEMKSKQEHWLIILWFNLKRFLSSNQHWNKTTIPGFKSYDSAITKQKNTSYFKKLNVDLVKKGLEKKSKQLVM